MAELQGLVILASLLAVSVGTYLIWPSRWNIPAHISLGFCFVAYVIPVMGQEIHTGFQDYLVRFYIRVLVLGAACFLGGLLLGGRISLEKLLGWKLRIDVIPPKEFVRFVSRRAALLMGLGLVGICAAFFFMGFVPMFAADPLAAKFFRGPYQWRNQGVAILYRFSYYTILTLIPVAFAAWYATKQRKHMLLALCGVAAISVTLTRESAAFGLLLFLGLVAARSRVLFRLYLVFVLLIFPFGAASYYLAGQLLGIWRLMGYYKTDSFWALIGSGASDVYDHLNFSGYFLVYGDFTHGRTFWGGLIPGNYRWNPAVWALSLMGGGPNRANVVEMASGGLRLPVSLWGYTAFGWPGAAGVSFLSGLLTGITTLFTKLRVDGKDVLRSMVFLTLYGTVWIQLSGFYLISMYSVPPILVALLLVYHGRVPSAAESAPSPRASRRYQYSKTPAAKLG